MEGNTHKYVAEEGSRDLFCRRAPHGARGLKRPLTDKVSVKAPSRPTRGAWIETHKGAQNSVQRWSRPTRGAWIETHHCVLAFGLQRSRPTRGAWIETDACVHCIDELKSRPTRGAWIETQTRPVR